MRKSLMAATALVALVGVGQAHAEMKAISSGGYWVATAGTAKTEDNNTVPMCAIQTDGRNPNGSRFYFALKASGGQLYIHLSKQGWHIPPQQVMNVSMHVDNAEGWYLPMMGDGSDNIYGPLGSKTRPDGEPWAKYVINLLGTGVNLYISFPEGNTPPWTLSLQGSQVALQSMVACVEHLPGSTPASGQPYGNGGGQPYGQQPTGQQPYGNTGGDSQTQQPKPTPIPTSPKYYYEG